jgi:hypothetical protein
MILHQMGHFQLNKRENDQVAKLGNTVIFNFICCEFCFCGLVVFYGDINKQFSGCGYFICESKSSTVIMNIYYYFLSISYHIIS